MNLHGKTMQDYIYCEDCRMMSDFWKYDHDITDAGMKVTNGATSLRKSWRSASKIVKPPVALKR